MSGTHVLADAGAWVCFRKWKKFKVSISGSEKIVLKVHRRYVFKSARSIGKRQYFVQKLK